MFYVGLDVSVARTSVCVMDAAGQVIREQSVASAPEAIAAAIRASGKEVERVGLEAGINSAWIARGLLEAKLPVIVIDATHAAAALKTGFRNKTDKNDARGIADLMRVNKFRAVVVKSVAAQRDRAPADGARAAPAAVARHGQRHLVHPSGRGAEATETDQPGLPGTGRAILR